MRTTLTLDNDVLILAQQTARRERVSLGKALSMLVRQGQPATRATAATPALRSKYSLLPARDEAISLDHVYRLMDEEGI
ncbi:MAG: CopG family transcriptional regulator [Pseudomonadota bacterium]|nr:CopG family transcriptional regulator [Pseudomonadota bacterium]